ncbi:autotransporter outer membrane beta-barrel domain-containing protein, partial [Aminobacter sp. AP02]|uniref:autotransporter outer membrane beta-barrel domain-containing protein n=1 Tax=Aminobacter sp. AP02 TaxID=2135737 RepID=UPI000D793DC8
MSSTILPEAQPWQLSTNSTPSLFSFRRTSSVLAITAALGATSQGPAIAQTVGPSPPTIATTINVTTGTTTVVGSTSVSTTAATNATNVTGGTLVIDSSAGPSPGPISFQSVNGNALQASGGTITVPNGGLSILTQGGHAVLANGATSSVTLNGAAISTTGTGAGLAAIGGTIIASAVVVNNTGTSTVNVSAGHGAIAESGGTVNLHAGTSITTGAFNAVGLGASGAGSRVIADALIPVTMNGRGAMGVYLHDGGQVTLLPGSTLQMNATSSIGVTADNTTVALGAIGSRLTINLNGVGVAGQAGSTGLFAVNGGTLALANVTITGPNAAAGAWARDTSSITISGNSIININAAQNPTAYVLQTANLITTSGQVGSIFGVVSAIPVSGLLAQGTNARVTSIGTTITVTSGNGAAGVDAGGLGATIDMTNNTITTTGANSFGVRVDSNGTVIGRGSSITTSGGGAGLFINGGPGSIDLTNTAVQTTGASTYGLYSLNLTPGSTNTVSLSGGNLTAADGVAVGAEGPLNLTVNGAVVTGGGGYMLVAYENSFGPQPTLVQLNASNNAVLTGHAQAEPLANANINLATGSHWTGGAFDITNVSVDPTSIWTMTASSTVRQQVTNAGLIDVTPPVGDPTLLASYKTLTTQNFVGQGGTIALNTYLGADGAPSDMLVINGGTATGLTSLVVRNTTGPGALTLADGIKVVDAINGASTANGSFVLRGDYVTKDGQQAVVGGAYAYTLFHNGVTDPTDSDWYLRSQIVPPPIPPIPPVPPEPRYSPGVPVYEVYPQNLLSLAAVPTLQQRVGNRYWTEPAPAPETVFCKDASQNFQCPVTGAQAQYYAGAAVG